MKADNLHWFLLLCAIGTFAYAQDYVIVTPGQMPSGGYVAPPGQMPTYINPQ